MKTKLFLLVWLLLCLNINAHAQGNLPPWLIELAPDENYILRSGPGGVYDHTLLDQIFASQGSNAFYKFVAFNESYTLPYDTLDRYDLITISAQVAASSPNKVITLPDIPDSINNGKIIVLNFDSGSETLDTVIVQASGNSTLIQSDCYQAGKTQQPDTFLVSQFFPRTVIYHTAYADDYYRACEGLVTLSDGRVILPGDTIPSNLYHTVPYMLARQQLHRPDTFPVTDYQGSLSNALDAKIVETNGELRMYFLGYKSYEPGIDSASYYYQVSTDNGRTWQLNDTVPFFTPEKNTDSLDVQLWEFFILKENATNWKMYYQGAKPDLSIGGEERYRSFLATSSDAGNSWTRQGLVLDVGVDPINDWDGVYAGVRSVVKFKGKYYMCYEGRAQGAELKMGIAISDDGFNFTKINGNGLALQMEPGTYAWETNAMIPYLQVVDSLLVVLYGNNVAGSPSVDGDNRFIGIAYSSDGINWQKYQNNPVWDLDKFPNEQNDRNNAFISFYEYKPGSWYLITREKSFANNFWDNGFYYLGNNLDFDLASETYTPPVLNEDQILFGAADGGQEQDADFILEEVATGPGLFIGPRASTFGFDGGSYNLYVRSTQPSHDLAYFINPTAHGYFCSSPTNSTTALSIFRFVRTFGTVDSPTAITNGTILYSARVDAQGTGGIQPAVEVQAISNGETSGRPNADFFVRIRTQGYSGVIQNNNIVSLLSDGGAMRLDKYGLGNITGTPTTYPAFDVDGKIIELPIDSINRDTLIRQYQVLPFNNTDTIETGAYYFLGIVDEAMANRRIIKVEATFADNVSQDHIFALWEYDATDDSQSSLLPDIGTFTSLSGTQHTQWDTSDSQIPGAGKALQLGKVLRYQNRNTANGTPYEANEGANGIYLTLYLIK